MASIQNTFLFVRLDPTWPRLVQITRLENCAAIAGCDPETPFTIELNEQPFAADRLVCSLSISEGQAGYRLAVPELELVIHFQFRLDDEEVVFTLEDVEENGNFRLEHLYIPSHRLITGTAARGDMYLRHIVRRSNWSRSWTPGTTVYNQWEDWGQVGDAVSEVGPLPANHACLWNEGACAAITTSIYVQPLVCELSGEGATAVGRAGQFRIWAGPYSYRLRGELADPLVVRIAVFGDYNHNGKIDWADAAAWEGDQWYRENALYRETLVYKVGLDHVKAEKANYTFEEVLDLIRTLYKISEGRKQIVYLVGWQDRGHDSGFPCHSIVNHRLGGLEGLRLLMEAARQYYCTVSLHANFDDSYPENPEHRPDLLSHGPDGKPYVWFFNGCTGTNVYSINHTLAMESGYHEDRLERLLKMLPLMESIHFDAHRAFNEAWVSADEHISAECEVQRGMAPLARLLQERGLNLTVEGSDDEVRGLYSWTWIAPNWLHPYTTVMRHGRQRSKWRDGMPRDILNPRLEGRAIGMGFVLADNGDDTPETMVQHYYQDWMYTQILYRKKMLDYRTGHWDFGVEAHYEDDTWACYTGSELAAVYEGIPIARGEERFLPWSEDTIYAYSMAGGEQCWTLPAGWDGASIEVVELVNGEEIPGLGLRVNGREINFTACANTPIRLRKTSHSNLSK
jgi:hypothetical protein